MSKSFINILVNPKKVLDYDDIKITVQGNSPRIVEMINNIELEAYLLTNILTKEISKTDLTDPNSVVQFNTYKAAMQKKINELSNEYTKRVISCSVRDVQTDKYLIEGEEIKMTFKPSDDPELIELDDISYTKLMAVLKAVSPDTVEKIFDFHKDERKGIEEKIVVDEPTEEDLKKKE